ncbi:hypothetical protein KUIN1_47610 [Pseudomonas sp. KUIN-1]|nr:hypothetical protein KUIN1_47610 [Pseudomonas sp. KUIN-1]
MGLGWYRSLPDGPSCAAGIKRRIAPIIGHVSTEIPDFGAIWRSHEAWSAYEKVCKDDAG